MSIKNQLMEKFGITKEEATNLIFTYARNHGGKVNMDEIEAHVERISDSIIFNVGNIYRDYDVKHEILDCGKDRQEKGLISLLDDQEANIANQYLRNKYWQNVDIWVRTFYDATKHEILEVLKNCDSIENYRNYVNTLPFKNIYALSDFLGIESEVVEFIVTNGTEKDLQQYMTDTRYARDGYDNNTQRIERKSCPLALSQKILSKAREELAENGEIKFNRRTMMAGLSAIHRNKDLSDEQKEELQELYMTKSLRGDTDELFINFVNSKVKVESPYEAIKEYLEKVDKKTGWEEKEDLLAKFIVTTEKPKTYLDRIVEEAIRRKELREIESKAQDLLAEYEEVNDKKQESLDDDE